MKGKQPAKTPTPRSRVGGSRSGAGRKKKFLRSAILRVLVDAEELELVEEFCSGVLRPMSTKGGMRELSVSEFVRASMRLMLAAASPRAGGEIAVIGKIRDPLPKPKDEPGEDLPEPMSAEEIREQIDAFCAVAPDASQAEAVKEHYRAVRRFYRESGVTMAQIGDALGGISRQAVFQMINRGEEG